MKVPSGGIARLASVKNVSHVGHPSPRELRVVSTGGSGTEDDRAEPPSGHLNNVFNHEQRTQWK